jgi:hypothetical protein
MRRREFAKLVAATVLWPVVAHAQRKPMRVIGLLYGPVANSGVDRTMGCADPSFTLY